MTTEYPLNLDDEAEAREFLTGDGDSRLRQYATLKLRAMDSRERGNIQTALRMESECGAIYSALPTELRW